MNWKFDGSELRVFDHVPTQLSAGDRQTLLAIQAALHEIGRPYAYLEIGSYLGGSLQPFLPDPLCETIVSIDARPDNQPADERGRFKFTPVTTTDMLNSLRPAFGQYFDKLHCIESDTRALDKALVTAAPRFCFIDGEHTDEASYFDFLFYLSVCNQNAIILFHDVQIIFRGLKRCVEYLDQQQRSYLFYLLPGKMAAIEIGAVNLVRQESLFKRVVSSQGQILEAFERLGYYRSWYFNTRSARLARYLSQLYNTVVLRRTR